MPAPKNPNTAAATAAVRRRGQETMAAKLRAAGWTVTPPEQRNYGVPAAVDQDAEDAAAFDRGYTGEARRQAAHDASVYTPCLNEKPHSEHAFGFPGDPDTGQRLSCPGVYWCATHGESWVHDCDACHLAQTLTGRMGAKPADGPRSA